MEKEIKLIRDKLEGFSFKYQEKPHLAVKQYDFENVRFSKNKIVLETHQRNFVLEFFQINEFLEKCEVVGLLPEKKQSIPATVIVDSNCLEMSEILFQEFKKISDGNFNEKDLEKSKSMCLIADKVIEIEKIKIKLLNR